MGAELFTTEYATEEDKQRVLSLVPQQAPFRYVGDIVEMTDSHIIGRYHYRPDEYFYKGHFPGNPVTPGVILVETMAQFCVTAHGIYMHLKKQKNETRELLTYFAECEIEFSAPVPPDSVVTVYGDKLYFRRLKLKSTVRLEMADGTVAASGTIAGMGVEI